MKELCVLVFLGVNSWLDLRRKEISLAAVLIFAMAGIVLRWNYHSINWEMFVSLGVGCFFLAISILTKGAVGLGDVWLLLALALVLDLQEFLMALFSALMLCALWGAVMLVIFRRNGRCEIPFVPFLLLGYVGGLLL